MKKLVLNLSMRITTIDILFYSSIVLCIGLIIFMIKLELNFFGF